MQRELFFVRYCMIYSFIEFKLLEQIAMTSVILPDIDPMINGIIQVELLHLVPMTSVMLPL